MQQPQSEEVEVEIIKERSDTLHLEIGEFFDSLDEERETFVSTLEDVLQSELLLAARVSGRIAGLTGIRRFYGCIPVAYYVVKKDYQGQGVAKALFVAKKPHLKPYWFILGFSMSHNRRIKNWMKRRNEYIVYDDGTYTYICHSKKPLFGPAVALLLSVALPPGMKLRRLWKRLAGDL